MHNEERLTLAMEELQSFIKLDYAWRELDNF
jgi:hypothetical protein